jgi:hypothetical protein
MSLILHAPQIRSWPKFERFEAILALELTSRDGTIRFGTAKVSGATEVDLRKRVVKVTSPRFDSVQFADPVPDELRSAVMTAGLRSTLEIPLDLFLAHLANEVLIEPAPPGFNVNPPPILIRSSPTLLLHVNGEPVYESVGTTGLQRVVNANWPLFRSTDGSAFFLLEGDDWQSSSSIVSGWAPASTLPEVFAMLPDEPPYRSAKAAYPAKPYARPATTVIHVTRPTELIVIDGAPALEAIAGAEGLKYVSNTSSPLFRLGNDWYYLAAGRWFKSIHLEQGPWIWTTELPAAFRQIPETHVRAEVRVSIAGTPEARFAALEAQLPTKVSAPVGSAAPVKVSYSDDPEFKAIPGTRVYRGINTAFDVLRYGGRYYLLYSGIWYVATTPLGPWASVSTVPSAIYAIPPSSPAYHVTFVTAEQSPSGVVVYTYPPAYTSGVYVAYGVPYYGTGWYYPPYVSGAYYYPYSASYGYGAMYNTSTGTYSSRSAWYGPYAGYSYNQAYNPATGRYGYVATAHDGDEWASYGQTYNPRTGLSTETSRYYNANTNSSEMGRTVQRGDQSVTTNRSIDYDTGVSQVERATSQGASSNLSRSASDGVLTTTGSVTTSEGERFAVDSQATREGGSTSITGADRSAAAETQRQNGRSVSTVEGTDGGQGVSVSGQGPGRTSVGQTSSGDLYAGHNGNVYKRSDDSWQTYENGEWTQVETPAPPSDRSTSQFQSRSSDINGRASSFDRSQLSRDFSARQNAGNQSRQRSMSGSRQRPTGGGGRRRGG